MHARRRLAAALATAGLALLTLGASSGAAAQDPEAPVHVVHLVIDSLDPAEVGPSTPTLLELRSQGTWYEQARAVMASETLPNHVAMATGTYAGRNGIPGNDGRVAPGDTEAADPDLGQPGLLTATSLTRAIEAQCPDLRTVTAFSKGYVHRVFAEDGADADFTQREAEIPESDHVPDSVIGAWVVEQLQESADYVFVNLGDVDRAGHVDPSGTHGLFAGGRQVAIQQVDAVVRTIVEQLRANGMWDRTVLIVNSDHRMDFRGLGQAELAGVDVQGALDADPRTTGRFFTSENGGAALVYLLDPAAADAEATLAAAREVLLGLEGVDEALYREPNALDPGHDLATVRPAWGLHGTDRAGELFVTVREGHAVGSNPLPGNHGHGITRHITALVTGGWSGVAAGQRIEPSGAVDQRDDTEALPEQAEQVDWAPTIGWLLGVDDPGVGTPQWQGRVLTEAFAVDAPPAPACVLAAGEEGGSDGGTPAPGPADDAPAAPDAHALPATGGGATLAGLGGVVAAAVLGRRRPRGATG